MKVLLTGANGFIGSHFYNHYKNDFEIYPYSIRDQGFDGLEGGCFEKAIHLSGVVHQSHSIPYEKYYEINVANTIRLATLLKKMGCKHFIFMSTVKVFGDERALAYSEISKCNPSDHYGKTKLIAEIKLQELEDENFMVSIIRPSIVYGINSKANIKKLIQLVKYFKIIPLGGINNKRSLVFLGNLSGYITSLLKRPCSGIFIACDDEPLSTSSLIGEIAFSINKKILLLKISALKPFIKVLFPSIYKRLYQSFYFDNSSSKSKLKLKNKYSTHEGIVIMMEEGK